MIPKTGIKQSTVFQDNIPVLGVIQAKSFENCLFFFHLYTIPVTGLLDFVFNFENPNTGPKSILLGKISNHCAYLPTISLIP